MTRNPCHVVGNYTSNAVRSIGGRPAAARSRSRRYCSTAAFTLKSMAIFPISADALVGSPLTPESGLPPPGASLSLRIPAACT